ncbi:hypothetical protein [Halogeometricum limi]|uniref:Uncharacterized protein n=1 Tax=Halogeometricum limi TaxID=555875 RepID=A0A1I6FY60_9EURY|nr:hypothetical protein [Halogeometricum limi]SFR34844.1 hypothetical protein SAMN04488124_0525 [Halogeometricum limi]
MTECPNCGHALQEADPHDADGADYVCEECTRKWREDSVGDLQRVLQEPDGTDYRE